MLAPRTILCVGRNYAAHAKELNNPVRKTPFFFLKPVSAIVEPPENIRLPRGATEVRHEVELVAVIGKTCGPRHPLKSREEAREAISGYRTALDLTAVNWQEDAKHSGLPWTMAKGFDTSLALSEYVDASRVPNGGSNVELHCEVDGEVRQKQVTGQGWLWDPAELLMKATEWITLSPGDLLLTGTPQGVGPLSPGNVITFHGAAVDSKAVSFHVVQD